MKRALIGMLNLSTVALPLAFAFMTVDPVAGPGLRAMTDGDCKRKAVFENGTMHCHEEGTNCVITCPGGT
ncbi:MAG: hypothetical protein IBJ03_06780 [Gemmatimonadaceae bacterium]|nr:hypothetical protein [Gemmatimonadaceae bacterium]